MEFAPKGLKVGDVFEDNFGNKLRVTQVFDFGYNTEAADVPMDEMPFALDDDEELIDDEEVEEKPKTVRRKTTTTSRRKTTAKK